MYSLIKIIYYAYFSVQLIPTENYICTTILFCSITILVRKLAFWIFYYLKCDIMNFLSCLYSFPTIKLWKEIRNDSILWIPRYACGPTVYDSSHIGHASSYVRQDIIRRIMEGYFHIETILVMGVTDIDDKIIKKTLEVFFLVITIEVCNAYLYSAVIFCYWYNNLEKWILS